MPDIVRFFVANDAGRQVLRYAKDMTLAHLLIILSPIVAAIGAVFAASRIGRNRYRAHPPGHQDQPPE